MCTNLAFSSSSGSALTAGQWQFTHYTLADFRKFRGIWEQCFIVHVGDIRPEVWEKPSGEDCRVLRAQRRKASFELGELDYFGAASNSCSVSAREACTSTGVGSMVSPVRFEIAAATSARAISWCCSTETLAKEFSVSRLCSRRLRAQLLICEANQSAHRMFRE
jgi:hypothetical protein